MRTEKEFIDNITQQINLSSVRRPHALTFDGLYAYEMGPIGISDISMGLRIKPWRLRAIGNDVFLTKSNDNNTAWENDTILFSFIGVDATEFDLAFDQNGSPIVVWQQSGSIWLYGYNTTTYVFDIRELGPGRSPRASIDNILYGQTQVSDILIFYINIVDDRVDYRAQKDRYDIVYTTDITDISNKYLELLTPALNGRLYLWFTEYNAVTDMYEIDYWHSSLYPQPDVIIETALAGDFLINGGRRTTTWEYTLIESELEMMLSGDELLSGTRRDTMFNLLMSNELIMLSGDIVVSGSSRDSTHPTTIEIDKITLANTEILNSTIRVSTFERTMDIETITLINTTILSATKV